MTDPKMRDLICHDCRLTFASSTWRLRCPDCVAACVEVMRAAVWDDGVGEANDNPETTQKDSGVDALTGCADDQLPGTANDWRGALDHIVDANKMVERPLTRAERRRLAEHRREESAWRTWLALTPEQQDHQRLRSLAREKAAFALLPIMSREGLEELHTISAGELANAAVEAFEEVMMRGLKDSGRRHVKGRETK